MRILLVEDDPALGEGIRTALKPEGYTVDWLQDGASALHALSHESFELVILDLGLPRMDGLQVLKHLRAAANPVPVLISQRFRPGRRLSSTSVPVGLRLTRISSPTLICCRREVSGPSGTLIEKNSSSSS